MVIALVVGVGPDTDAFFAAYSLYLFFALFGSTLRVALVPLMGPVADEGAWRARAENLIARLSGTAGVVVVAVALLSPLLGRVLTPGLPEASTTAIASLAILALAAYCQIAAAALAAALAAARRFPASALLYVASSVTTLVMATVLLALLGILGAALGVLAGSALLLAGHRAYLARFDFRARPRPTGVRERTTWRMVGLASAGAAIPLAQQFALSIALAAVSGEPGAVTAYTYAYFVGALVSGVTVNAIAFVMVPGMVSAVEKDGERGGAGYLTFAVPVALYLFVPVACAYAFFGLPLLELVFADALGPRGIEILWDASRLFLAMNVGMALLAPGSALVLTLRRYGALVWPSVGLLAVHTAVVVPLAITQGAVVAAVAHAALGALLLVPVLALGLSRQALRCAAVGLWRALPAAALALVFVPLAVLVPAPGWLAAAALAAAGLTAYLALGTVLWPAVAGRTLRMLRGER